MINVEIMHLCLHPQIIEKSVIDYSSPSLVQRGIFLYHQWYGGISLHAFSGTWACVIVSGTAVHLFHRQWYVDDLSFLYHQWYGGISLHAFSGTWACVIVSGTAVHLFHRQWYVDDLSFYIISGTVIYLFMPSVERGHVLSSVVRRYISL